MMEREDGVLDWARQHNCSFGVNKFKLVDFTRRRKHIPGQTKTELIRGPGVNIGSFEVKSEPHAPFLGALMDKALRWKEQHAVMLKRGQGWITNFRRLSKMKDGMAGKHIRQFYKSKAITQMLYAADVVLVPQQKNNSIAPSAIVKQLTLIQRQAAILISGAMSTTATDILNIHAALLPMPLEIQRQRQ